MLSCFGFFRTRYAALVAAQTLEHTNPMLWVTEMAPEPEDVLWANICVPYRLLWAVFFMTYILTSGWTSLAFELVQPFPLLLHWLDKGLFRGKNVLSYESQTFPYHTELPRALLFVLLAFTSAVTAPLMLPFLLIYFFMAYLIYRNQLQIHFSSLSMSIYVTKYDTGGLYWPIAHSAIIFSLMLMQVIVLGVFGLKKSAVASGFTIPLIVCTFLFHLYCRQRFLPVFKRKFPQVIMEMDKQDELSRKLEEYHDQLLSGAYCQLKTISKSSSTSGNKEDCENGTLDFALVAQVKQSDSNDQTGCKTPKRIQNQ